jgi:nuclear pore complex protein Nup160
MLPKKADVAYIPYNLIDRVIAATKESPEKEDEVLQTRVRALEEDLKRRIEGLEKIRIA